MSEVGFIAKLKNRTLAEFSQEPKFKVSDTMSVLDSDEIPVDYVVIRLNGKTYSTQHTQIGISKLQLVKTKEVGCQNNIWLKGVFKETDNHQQIPDTPFELNIYLRCQVEGDE